METESRAYNWLSKKAWIALLIVYLISALISVGWYLRDRDYEPALAAIAAVLLFFTTLFGKGIKGFLFGLGIIVGSGLAYLLLFFTSQFAVESVKTEPKQAQEKRENLSKDNEELKNQITELENLKNSSQTELDLRKQIRELQNQIENSKQEAQQPASNQSVNSDVSLSKPITSLTVNDVLLEIVRCQAVSGDIEIEFMITNKGVDRNLTFESSTSITNESGIKFEADNYFQDNFISSVRRKAKFKFKQAGQSKTIIVLEILFNREKAQFRNLTVSR